VFEGYFYEGELALAIDSAHSGAGGGGGGGAGGDGGNIVLITSHLTKTFFIDPGYLTTPDVSRGNRGVKGVKGGNSGGGEQDDGNNGGHGVAGTYIEIII
jgi:hypothetical protein